MSLTRHQLGLFGALAIIGLRLTIGFHFFSEGLDKLTNPKPFTATFLGAAKGPFAPLLRSYVWDSEGLIRLGYEPSSSGYPRVDMGATEQYWDKFAQRVAEHYRFDDQQKKRAASIVTRYKRRLRDFASDYEEDLVEYFKGVERGRQQAATDDIQDVASLRGQAEQWQATLKGKAAPLLTQVNLLWSGLERDLNALAKPSQSSKKVAIGKLQGRFLDAESIDKFIPWFDLLVGLSLIVGLFTRVSAVLGAVFLAMVVSSQWPGATGAMATWPQMIEMFALLSLAAVHAGQYGGLDFLVRAARAKCCPPQKRK